MSLAVSRTSKRFKQWSTIVAMVMHKIAAMMRNNIITTGCEMVSQNVRVSLISATSASVPEDEDEEPNQYIVVLTICGI